MKLSKKERLIIQSRRKFIEIKWKSERITKYRKRASQSKGERKIVDFLVSEGVEFVREWYFKGLYNQSKTNLLYFDFYVPKYNLCIEYDGQQHYDKNKSQSQKVNDFLKNAYCLKNGVWLLRIKYTDFDNIEMKICQYIDKITRNENC